MPGNVLDDAALDVMTFASNKDAHAVARKLADRKSTLYHAEMVSLLSKQGLLQSVKQVATQDASTAHATYDADRAQQQPGRAESVAALQHHADADRADGANAAIADGEQHVGWDQQGAADGQTAAGKSPQDIWVTVFENAMGADRIYVERFLYEIKRAGKLGFLKTVSSQDYRHVLGQALGLAERDGLITAAEVVAQAQPPMSAGLGAATQDGLTADAAQTAAEPVVSARERLQKAEEKIRTLEEQLHIALQEITPVIADQNAVVTNGQSPDADKVRRFITTYRDSPEYRAAQFELTAARKALGLEIADAEVNLAQHANDTLNPDTANQAHSTIIDSYMTLAASDQPEIAKQWVLNHRGDSAYVSKVDQQRLQNIDDLATDTRANIAVTNLKAIFATPATDLSKLDAAIAYLDQNVIGPYDAFDKLGQLREISGLLKLQRTVWAIRGATDPNAALMFAKLFIADGAKDAPIGQKIGTALGTMILGFGPGGLRAAGGNILEHGSDIRDFYAKGKELRELLRTPGTTAEQAAELAKQVRGSYFTFSRGIGALAVVGDVYAVKSDWDLASSSATPATYGKLVGDLMATVGDAMTLIPGLEPLGEAISIVGTAISLIAGAFIGDPVGDQRRDSTRQTLIDGGLVTPAVAQAVTKPDAAGNVAYAATLTGASALTPDQLQSLATTHAFLFAQSGMIEACNAVWKWYCGRNDSGFQLQGSYRASLFNFIKGGDGSDDMGYHIMMCRSGVANGQFLQIYDYNCLGAAVDLRMNYPTNAFAPS